MSAPALIPDLPWREFAWLAELIQERSGIHLRKEKRALLARRLRSRLRQLGLETYRQYTDVLRRDPDEIQELLDRISTQETAFFREEWQFEFLRREAFPRWRGEAAAGLRPSRLRVWSAACATGEEPYTVALLAADLLPPEEGWHVEILATDLSRVAVERTRAASWPAHVASRIPIEHRHRWLQRQAGTDDVTAHPDLRRLVRVRRLNLARDRFPGGTFDLILCRNALMYLHLETRREILDRLVHRLAPDGYLCLGHAETAQGFTRELSLVVPSTYCLRGPVSADRSGR